MMRHTTKLLLGCCLLALFLFAATASHAAIIIDIVGINTETEAEMKTKVDVPLGESKEFVFEDYRFGNSETMWQVQDLDVSGNIDPEVTLAYALTNNASVPVAFTINVTVPIAPPLLGGTLHGGSVGGAVLDTGQPVSISTVSGKPLYSGEIDGSTVLALYPDPTSFTGNSIATIPGISSGLPGPTNPSGPALATIGITNQFILGPGDTLTLGNNFVVVPEPATVLLMLACSGLILRSRRR